MPKGKGYEGQTKTGVTREVSTNKERRTGRDDGTGGAQKETGHHSERNGPAKHPPCRGQKLRSPL
jgi:hypothetical protein